MSAKLAAIPTNIITGFLGVGKTTVINYLMEHKPADERWAILVNEFGEIGIDGSMISGKSQDGVFIREVPGGCMCCTSGLPMQIALNQLLAKAKPHRLLIEPTGLGHPQEVIDVFCEEHYRELIDLKAVLTLIDPRKLDEQRYRENQIFRQQLEVADVVVATKSDCWGEEHKNTLNSYLKELPVDDLTVVEALHGNIDPSLLEKPTRHRLKQPDSHYHHHHADKTPDASAVINQEGFYRTQNARQGYVTFGWGFDNNVVFSFKRIMSVMTGMQVERCKAVFITDDGIYCFNMADGVLTSSSLDESDDSRIELIDEEKNAPFWETFESKLKEAIL